METVEQRVKKIVAEQLGVNEETVKPILTHASYLINLATTNQEFHGKSIAAMIDELDRAERLGSHAVVRSGYPFGIAH